MTEIEREMKLKYLMVWQNVPGGTRLGMAQKFVIVDIVRCKEGIFTHLGELQRQTSESFYYKLTGKRLRQSGSNKFKAF